MKKEQQRLLELLKEIHQLCVDNKIEYFLSPRTAFYASLYDELPENVNDNEVVMTIPNVRKFLEAFRKKKPQGRVLESMENSGHYPGLSFRYVDTGTYYVNIFQGDNYECPGLAICIRPLRGRVNSKEMRIVSSALEMGWLQNCYTYNIKSKGKWVAYGVAVKCMMMIGRKNLSNKLFNMLMKAYDNPKTQRYLIRRWDKDMFLDKELFRKKGTLSIQGFHFPVPADLESYMAKLPKNWTSKTVERAGQAWLDNVYAVNVGYGEAERIMPREKAFFRRRRRHYKRMNIVRKARKYYLRAWDIANQSGEKFHLQEYYKPRMERIQNLSDAGDYCGLARELQPYDEAMQRYLSTGYRIVFDRKLYEIYLELLAVSGRWKLRERIEGLKE